MKVNVTKKKMSMDLPNMPSTLANQGCWMGAALCEPGAGPTLCLLLETSIMYLYEIQVCLLLDNFRAGVHFTFCLTHFAIS